MKKIDNETISKIEKKIKDEQVIVFDKTFNISNVIVIEE